MRPGLWDQLKLLQCRNEDLVKLGRLFCHKEMPGALNNLVIGFGRKRSDIRLIFRGPHWTFSIDGDERDCEPVEVPGWLAWLKHSVHSTAQDVLRRGEHLRERPIAQFLSPRVGKHGR